MEAATAKRERASQREREEEPEAPAGPQRDSQLIRQAKEESLPEGDVQDALEAFLRAEGDEEEVVPTPLTINLGDDSKPNKIKWVILPVDDTEITRIRENSRTKGSRAQRRRGEGEVDEALVARKIVAKATVDPDLKGLAKKLSLVDPVDALYAYFKKFGKTGLITQISGEVLSISGWDDEAVQAMEVEAAQG